MSGLRGNPDNLRKLAQRLSQLSVRLAQNVATDVAPVITSRAENAYDSGQTVYGGARPTGVGGNTLTLVRSRMTRDTVHFVAVGTLVRCVLGPPWAKYLIGKYQILPNGRLPVAWSKAIGDLARERIAKTLEGKQE